MSWWNPIDAAGKILPTIGKATGAGKGEDYRQQELQKALDEYKNLYQPSIGQLSGGNIRSSYQNEDPRLKRYQMGAIENLRNIYSQGGLDANAKARLDEIRRREDLQARGAREAIMQDSRSRGVGGGNVLSQMLNAQASADRRSAADTQVSADAETRAIQALLNSANLSGDVRGQDFERMSALDAIKRFNTQNRANAYQQRFANQYGVAGDRANIYGGIGDARANQYQKRWSVVPNVIGKMMDTAATAAGGASKKGMV